MLKEKIGETAGAVWHALEKTGPIPLSQLPKQVNAPESLVKMALGWLAREDKIQILNEGRSIRVTLK